MKCQNCGFKNPDSNTYCENCGTLLKDTGSNKNGRSHTSKISPVLLYGFIAVVVILIIFGIIKLLKKPVDIPSLQDALSQTGDAESVQNSQTDEDTTPTQSSNEPSGKIVFTCQVDRQVNHDQICIINADGSGWQQLTDNISYEHYYSSLSADGSEIVFSSSLPDRKGFNIFIMNSDGSSLRQLTSGLGDFYAPDLSPDGQYIIATRHINSTNYISLLTRDGDFIKDLNSYYDCKDPVWSPDGQQILFAADPDKTGIQFYIMNKDGSNVRKVTAMDGLRGRSDWSIDGTMASYTGEYSLHNRELFLFGENGSAQIITDGGDNLAPSFSPDGKWITFMSYRDNYWDSDGCEIYIMRLEDGYTVRLTNNDYCDYQPRWSK